MSVANTIDDVAALTFFTPLRELDHDKLTEVAQGSSLLRFKKGQPLAAGIEKNHIVLLLTGSVERNPNSAAVEIIKADSERARQPILAPGKRTRVIAQSNVQVLAIDAELLDLLLNWGDAGDGFVVDEIDADAESADWLDSLMQSDAVLSLSPASIQALMAVVEPVEAQADEVIFQQGDRPDYYYIISRGRCAVTRRSGEQSAPVELATLGAGEAFGEEALIANTERSATVRMVENGLLLRLDQQNFKQLLEQSLVTVVDHDRAESLKARGAELLDLRSATDFAADGAGINIPFVELRSRMHELQRERKYLVTSDDNRMSAVAAFLLSKQGLKVYVLQTSLAEGFAEKAAAATAQADELRTRLDDIQQQLEAARAKLKQEEQENSANRQKVQALEAELKKTQGDARRAIAEAGSLKKKAEAALRERINKLTSELDSEKTRGRSLVDELRQAKNRLATLDEQLQTSQQQAEQSGEDSSLMRLRLNNLTQELGQERNNSQNLASDNDRLNGRLAQLTSELEEARARLEQSEQLPDLEALQAELESERQTSRTLGNQNDELQQRLTALDDELQQVRRQGKQSRAELEKIQGRGADLQTSVEQLQSQLTQSQQAERAAHSELEQVQRQAAQQAAELNEFETKLQQQQEQTAQAEQAHEALLVRVPQLESELEAGNQTQLELERQVDALTQSRGELEETVTQLTGELEQLSQVVVQRDTLQQKFDSLKSQLVEKESHFTRTVSEYKDQVYSLETELNSANLTALEEADKAEQEISRLQLRNKILDEELSRLQNENKRSGRKLKIVLFLIVALGGGLGAALYAGIDVQGEALRLIQQAEPHANRLIDSLVGLISAQ